jgi:hypothetical protein
VNYWQVAAGSESEQRDYAPWFLQYGFAFVGGDEQRRTMRRVRSGDVIALKEGMSKIVAAGRVVERNDKAIGDGDKEWMRDFDGWDLPAYCYVDWHKPSEPIDARGLGRRAIEPLNSQEAQRVAERILQEDPQPDVHPEPCPVRNIEDKEILKFLVQEGLQLKAAEELTAAFNRIRLLANYYFEAIYQRQEIGRKDIGEHEARAFLILPLLTALGWPEQQMKMELWVRGETPQSTSGRIDIACFAKPYRRNKDKGPNNEDCTLIIETKHFGAGLVIAPEQGKAYAEHFPHCKAVLVSNGYCYKAYERDQDTQEFPKEPSAYLNLLRPRDGYPLDPDNVKGALEVLWLMLPQSWR